MTAGRKRGQPPAMAYDYRRAILLVQVLAESGSDEPIRALCEAWGVEPVYDMSEPPYRGKYCLQVWSTIIALAKHAVEYHRAKEESAPAVCGTCDGGGIVNGLLCLDCGGTGEPQGLEE